MVVGSCSYENDLILITCKGRAVFLIYTGMFAHMPKKGKRFEVMKDFRPLIYGVAILFHKCETRPTMKLVIISASRIPLKPKYFCPTYASGT